MVLLAAVTLSCIVAAGTAALVTPAQEPAPQTVADIGITEAARVAQPVSAADRTDVRVVGTRFVPNVNPRER